MREVPESVGELPLREFAAGSRIIEEGATPDSIFFLERGTVQVLKDGVEIATVSDHGAIFGEMSLLLGEAATASVVSLGDVAMRVAEDPQGFLESHPDMLFYVGEILARRLDRLNRYLVDVKQQFADHDDHLGMLDGVLDTLMTKHPRQVVRRTPTEP